MADSTTYRGGFSRIDRFNSAAHTFSYIPLASSGSDHLTIRHAGTMDAEVGLKNSRIKITLDRLRVAGYPGFGKHQILFEFYAQNQLPQHSEDQHFNITCPARDGSEVAALGYPIFVGLGVGNEGVQFRCLTINVKNEGDAFLGFLDTDVFKSGLKLATVAQPAIAPFSHTGRWISDRS